MLTICLSQLQVFEKVSPRCLCEWVSSIITSSIEFGGRKIKKTDFLFPEINIDNVLLGLKVTGQHSCLKLVSLKTGSTKFGLLSDKCL